MTATWHACAAVLAAFLTGGSAIYTVAGAPPDLRPVIQRGDLVIVSLQSAILSELRAALAHGRPEHALQSCHLDAAATAMRIERHEGVRAGRTSAHLRDPANAAPPWAAGIVARHRASHVRDVEGFVVDFGDRVGLLRPMVEQAICDTCHGPAERMGSELRRAIAERYPADRATGFKEGDLRGWFWVELPKPRDQQRW